MKDDISNIIHEIENMTGYNVTAYSAKKTQFRDSSLGIHEKGQNYMQVITPGYIIHVKLRDNGNRFSKVYHSNLEGSILKEKP